jgi:hypothetical protein
MSTNIVPCYALNDIPCNCTYSTVVPLAGAFTATVVATKVGDDFPFYGLVGVGGTSVLLNPATNIIEISGGGAGGGSLQTAYNVGNTIITAGGLPVSIQSTAAPALVVRDAGPTGLFSITSTVPGDANIVFSNQSGITLNNPIAAAAPTSQDPLAQVLTFAPPSAVAVGSTITAAANIGAATPANYVYSYTPPVTTPATSVSRVKIQVVGYTAGTNSMFSFEVNARLAPGSAQQVLLGNINSELDAALATLTIDVAYTANTLNFALIGGPTPGVTTYLARGSAIATVLQY